MDATSSQTRRLREPAHGASASGDSPNPAPTISAVLGGRKKRVERLSAGAEANFEDGESIRELVQTQTGQSAAANASAVGTSGLMSSQLGIFYRSEVSAGPHVLVATDRNLYAMKLSGGRLLDVGDVVLKVPLDKADLYQGKKTLTFGDVRAIASRSHVKDAWTWTSKPRFSRASSVKAVSRTQP